MSEAIFEELLQGKIVSTGGQLKGFLLCSCYDGLKNIVRLEHLESSYVIFHKWFLFARDKNHKKSYSLCLKNKLEENLFLISQLSQSTPCSNSKPIKLYSYVYKSVDSFIKEVSNETSIVTKT